MDAMRISVYISLAAVQISDKTRDAHIKIGKNFQNCILYLQDRALEIDNNCLLKIEDLLKNSII